MTLPDPPPEIASALDAAPAQVQPGLWALRRLVLETAATLPEVGTIFECLKWGQPSFTTPDSRSESTLRIGCPKAGGFALYAHCRTTIISDFVQAFPGLDRVDGNRAILFSDPSEIDPARHAKLVVHALRYHL